MTDDSILNESSILRNLEAEYEALCSQSKEQSAKIETLNQEIYSLRNRVQVAERVQEDCQLDLESQQQQLSEVNAAHEAVVSKLKEEHAKVVQDLRKQIDCLENDLLKTQKETSAEKEEFFRVRKELQSFQDASPVASLKAELQEVSEELAANRVACAQHQELNRIVLKEKNDLIEEVKSTREHLETLEEKLRIYKSDHADMSETIEELRDSLAVTQSELSCLKANPADTASRGNSLFAEVEDKRQAMLKKCSTLSKRYYDMKRDYDAKCTEISRLKLENLKLSRQWQEEAEERDNRDVWLKDNYEIRIKELLQMVENLKREERPVFVNGDSKILSWAEREVEISRKEMAKLREEMEWRSSERLNEAKALYLARGDVLKFKGEVMTLRAENLILREKLEEANILDIPSPGKTVELIKKALRSTDESTEILNTKEGSTDLGAASMSSQEILDPKNHKSNLLSSLSSRLSEVPKPKHLMRIEIEEEFEPECRGTESPVESTEDIQSTQDHQTTSAQSDEFKCSQEDFLSNSDVESESFPSSSVKQTMQCVQGETSQPNGQDVPTISQESDTYESEMVQVKLLGAVSETQLVCAQIPEGLQEDCDEKFVDMKQKVCPKRSILSKLPKPSRSSLAPVDQNLLSRKVRFAENKGEGPPFSQAEKEELPPCGADVQAKEITSPKRKLARMPQPRPYKTRIIISKETELQ